MTQSILSTIPGVLFARKALNRSCLPLTLPNAASMAMDSVDEYLYGAIDPSKGELDIPTVSDIRLEELESIVDDLNEEALSSPFIHWGASTKVHEPVINGSGGSSFSMLPRGAFWTSIALSDEADTWSICGENIATGRHRFTVDFDRSAAAIYQIDNLHDWDSLVERFSPASSSRRIDWNKVGDHYDGIFLSITGLLLANPLLDSHIASLSKLKVRKMAQKSIDSYVGSWSVVSVAWLKRPPGIQMRS